MTNATHDTHSTHITTLYDVRWSETTPSPILYTLRQEENFNVICKCSILNTHFTNSQNSHFRPQYEDFHP